MAYGMVGNREAFVDFDELGKRQSTHVSDRLIAPGISARGTMKPGIQVERSLCTMGAKDLAETDVVLDAVVPTLHDFDHRFGVLNFVIPRRRYSS